MTGKLPIFKQLTLKRLSSGENGVFDGNTLVGVIPSDQILGAVLATDEEEDMEPVRALAVDEIVTSRATVLMEKENITFARAMKRVLASDPKLEERYRAAHGGPQVTGQRDIETRWGEFGVKSSEDFSEVYRLSQKRKIRFSDALREWKAAKERKH